jgi:hypothetical protein
MRELPIAGFVRVNNPSWAEASQWLRSYGMSGNVWYGLVRACFVEVRGTTNLTTIALPIAATTRATSGTTYSVFVSPERSPNLNISSVKINWDKY